MPEQLNKLSYDEYQSIHFIPTEGPWQNEGLRFTFQFFLRGFIYQAPVQMDLLERGQAHEFTFSPKQFDFGKIRLTDPLPADLRFAGLRALFPINVPDKQDEVASFLGASYFRIIGAHQRYGASARGLAIDTAEPTGEEFPRFTQFWIEKPGALDNTARLFALLESPSVAGAYKFEIRPGETTQVDVEATLFLRKAVKKLGIAPVTSMFLMGENRTQFIPDFRPEVHDSDGLLVESESGDWIWRPLVNPQKEHVVSRLPANKVKGFGLLQRDRHFENYQDLASRYELRPSLWIEPRENWGTGSVELVEIPTPVEWNDNIVAYWVPDEQTRKGQELRLNYRVSACREVPQKNGLMLVEATRITVEHDKTPLRFVIDFNANGTPSPPADTKLEVSVQTSQGTIRNLVAERNEVTGGWRMFFDLVDEGTKPVDLRAFLHKGSEVLSETWVYHYQRP